MVNGAVLAVGVICTGNGPLRTGTGSGVGSGYGSHVVKRWCGPRNNLNTNIIHL